MNCMKFLSVCVNPPFILPVLLDPADEKLLEEDIQAPSSSKRYECKLPSFLMYCIHVAGLGYEHVLVLKVTAACQSGPMDEKDRVHFNRV